MRVRGRSGSIVKVEQVGDRSAEDALDQNVFVNINANWVNAKGAHTDTQTSRHRSQDRRSMAHSRRPHTSRQGHRRHNSRHVSTN